VEKKDIWRLFVRNVKTGAYSDLVSPGMEMSFALVFANERISGLGWKIRSEISGQSSAE